MPMRYRTLDTVKDEVRLLHIFLKKRGRLHFRLVHFPLQACPEFWAFSYTWGDQLGRHTIVVDGHTVPVMKNLGHALRHHVTILLRIARNSPHSEFKIRYLWVDALCINQSDFEERALQIPRMRQIYSMATVGVFLDNGDTEPDKTAHSTLSDLCKQSDQGLKPSIAHDAWHSINSFFTESYFTRDVGHPRICYGKISPLAILVGLATYISSGAAASVL
jgi:hypothetical protein